MSECESVINWNSFTFSFGSGEVICFQRCIARKKNVKNTHSARKADSLRYSSRFWTICINYFCDWKRYKNNSQAIREFQSYKILINLRISCCLFNILLFVIKMQSMLFVVQFNWNALMRLCYSTVIRKIYQYTIHMKAEQTSKCTIAILMIWISL